MSNYLPVSYEGTATTTSGGTLIPLKIRSKINYFINNSADYPILLNFQKTIGENGTITIPPLRGFDDLECSIDSIAVQGVGGSADFAILGV